MDLILLETNKDRVSFCTFGVTFAFRFVCVWHHCEVTHTQYEL